MSDMPGGYTSRIPSEIRIPTTEELKAMLLECQKMAAPQDWIVIEPSGIAHKGALADIARFIACRYFAQQSVFKPFDLPADEAK